jgi:hypothetical protein
VQVYLIHDASRDLHKIGVSTDPVRRLRQLQTGNAQQLALVACFATGRAHRVENSLHVYHRTSAVLGEWFNLPAGAVADFLKRCAFFDDYHARREPGYYHYEV